MKRTCLYLLFLSLLPGSMDLAAQYVQRNSFATEGNRRQVYSLDAWVSYLPARQFSSMAVGTNFLYVATRGAGILRYELFDNYWEFPFTTSNGLPSNDVLEVRYDPETSFLFAVFANDAAVFNPASQEWIVRSENLNWNYKLPPLPEGTATDEGLRDVFRNRGDLRELPVFFANGAAQLTGDWMLIDENFEQYEVTGYLRDRFDRVWFTVDGYGLGRGDLYSQRADFFETGLPDIAPRALEYQYNDLWIGGVAGKQRNVRAGIARWPEDGSDWQYFRKRFVTRLRDDNVNSILADGDSVWFATEYGVALYDAGKASWKSYTATDGLVSNRVLDLAILDNSLFAATAQGMSRISLLTGRVEKFTGSRVQNLEIRRLAISQDTLWLATDRGIFRYDSGDERWDFVPTTAAIQDLDISAVTVMGEEVWFAGHGGVMMLNITSGSWQSFPQLSFEIEAPYADIKVNDEAVWVASMSGLLKYDREKRYWRLFTTEDGLLDNHCRQLLLDGDYIWVVTDSGLSQYFCKDAFRGY